LIVAVPCRAIRPAIPDFIEIGVDILNPVQISAQGMDPSELKREFGKDIVFWGGGVDTQHIFGSGTPQDVQDNVRRNIDALALGGGLVFPRFIILKPMCLLRTLWRWGRHCEPTVSTDKSH
jgi:hypothetical protein